MIGFAAMIFSHPDFSETLPMLTKLVFASSTMHQLVITSLSPGTRLSPDYGPRAQAVVALERQRPVSPCRRRIVEVKIKRHVLLSLSAEVCLVARCSIRAEVRCMCYQWTMARVQQLHDGEQTGGRKGHSSG
ncbi:hypothetical protein PC111_g16848 [Phytophthora cactorum]|nr:hypothetical protein PC111_g16848 [Phytophthora cactorum]